jgi:cytidine deaminase
LALGKREEVIDISTFKIEAIAYGKNKKFFTGYSLVSVKEGHHANRKSRFNCA